jgi:predicted ATPase
MIRSYTSQRRSYNIVPPGYGEFPGANTFTVIVGKNGTGKSRLLQGVVSEILKDRISSDLFDREERMGRLNPIRRSIDLTEHPSKIICISTSPFDKFPLLRRGESSSFYSYLGLRGLPSQNLSTAYMSRIIASLIRSAADTPSKSSGIADVLHYLGYDGVMRCTFSVGLPSRIQDELLNANDLFSTIRNLKITPPLAVDSISAINSIRQLKEANQEELERALNFIRSGSETNRKPRLDIFIDREGIQNNDIQPRDIIALVGSGLARLRDVSLRKAEIGSDSGIFRLSEASSGEQSVMMGLLGIASQIEDNSLICIDEPEVCLHPEWQERYVHLLLETFSNRRGCQFIIATHSPQVVAELPQSNCFVMNMDDGKAIEAKKLSHRSVDFQLASVFRTPGRHNEFLNRIALNLFSRVSSSKIFHDEDHQSLELLEELFDTINHTDPLRDLIIALRAMKSTYAKNQ